jgi:hypothetical protein
LFHGVIEIVIPDITFKRKDYNFTLDNIAAADKPKGWHIDYLNPTRMTI